MNEFPGENHHQIISSSIHEILIDQEKIKLQIWKFPSEEVNFFIPFFFYFQKTKMFLKRDGSLCMKNILKIAEVKKNISIFILI
jgi:hypothetical protein